MAKFVTVNTAPLWAGYKDLLWNVLHALNGIPYEDRGKLLLNRVEDKAWEEYHELDKQLRPFHEQWENLDLTVIKQDGYYKEFWQKLESYDATTTYHHVVGFEGKYIRTVDYRVSKNSIWPDIYGPSTIDAKNFALKIVSKQMIEVSADEFNEIAKLSKEINEKFYGSRENNNNGE